MFKISIFSKIYEACIGAARHKFASIFLAIFSFIESIFWPIPTDVVLAPMCLAKPNRALLYALNATVTSVLGAVVGYYIGYWLSTAFVKEFFESVNMIGTFNTVNEYLNEFGILFILIGSFLADLQQKNDVNGRLIELNLTASRRLAASLVQLRDRSTMTYDGKGNQNAMRGKYMNFEA